MDMRGEQRPCSIFAAQIGEHAQVAKGVVVKMEINGRASVRSVVQAAGILVLSILAFMAAVGSSAPAWAQGGCRWFGTQPVCDGQCPGGYVYTGHRKSCAVSGSQRYCCPAPMSHEIPKGGINCRWAGSPPSVIYVCDEALLKFYIKNNCRTAVAVQVQFMPPNRGWQTNDYRFSPGEVGYLVDTKNRFIYVTAHSIDGKHRWPRHRVDMGGKLDKKHTHTLNCP
jgi:hypothetical protein